MKIPVLIDCDPGIDDAIALLLAFASEKLDIKAVTVVGGNQTVEKTLANALAVLDYAGITVPVAKGASHPLTAKLVTAPEVHGESGLGGFVFPAPSLEPIRETALQLMGHVLWESSEPVTIIATAPLTNLALLLSACPGIGKKIKRISLMGGACNGGNQTPVAEYNMITDPEAARIVFESGIPIVMCGLDVTTKAVFTENEIETVAAMNGKVSRMAAALMKYYLVFHKQTLGVDGIYIHDACAVANVIDPTLFQTVPCHVDIETHGEFTRGATVVDLRARSKAPKNADVALDVNRERFFGMLIEAIKSYEQI